MRRKGGKQSFFAFVDYERKTAGGVEKTFPLHSPRVADVEGVRHGKVRRSKLYYLRDKVGKAAKIKEKAF